MARFTGPVRFHYTGNVFAGRQLRMDARELIGVIGTPSRRDRGANGMRRIRLPDNSTVTVYKTAGIYNAHIHVPPKKGPEYLSPGAFVVYPYTGWMYPAYYDRRPNGSTNTVIATMSAYYAKKQEAIPTKPYWLDTKNSYRPTVPTEYLIEKIGTKNADTEFDPIFKQITVDGEVAPALNNDESDQYNSYGYWRSGKLVDGEWVEGSWFLHWADKYCGTQIQPGADDYGEAKWGKFIYVNGVKFPTPDYVHGGAVYNDPVTQTNWLLITCWTGELTSSNSECLNNRPCNVYAHRLRTTDSGKPIATNDGAVTTVTDFNTAFANNDPSVKNLSRDWFPLNDATTGFTIPRTATNKGLYHPTCGSYWPGEKYLGVAYGFRFNQSANKFAYVAVIEGDTAQEFNEFSISFGVTKTGDYYIPTTFSETLITNEYIKCEPTNYSTRWDNTWHDYATAPLIIGQSYKEDVLQKMTCYIRAKFNLYSDTTYINPHFKRTDVERTYYVNGTPIATQIFYKENTGTLFYSGVDFLAQNESGSCFPYYDLTTGDYVKETYSYVVNDRDGDTDMTYGREIKVNGVVLTTDSGTHSVLYDYDTRKVNWPLDDYEENPWKMQGSISAIPGGGLYSPGPQNTDEQFFYDALYSIWSDRVQVGYWFAPEAGPGHLMVHRGHEKGHIAGAFVSRSVNAGPNGIYYNEPIVPLLYTYGETDEKFRVAQHHFVFGINNADKLYAKYGVKADTINNTVPLINTCFYRKTGKTEQA